MNRSEWGRRQVDHPQSQGARHHLREIRWSLLDSSAPSYRNPRRSLGHLQGYCQSALFFHCNPTQKCCGRLTCGWSPAEDSEINPCSKTGHPSVLSSLAVSTHTRTTTAGCSTWDTSHCYAQWEKMNQEHCGGTHSISVPPVHVKRMYNICTIVIQLWM